MSTCLSCLRPLAAGDGYHDRCVRALFDARRPPAIVDVDLAKLHTLALAMVGRQSLSGVQRKVSVGLTADKQTLHVALGGSQYILKPQSATYPELPQNELLTMRVAETGRRADPRVRPGQAGRLVAGLPCAAFRSACQTARSCARRISASLRSSRRSRSTTGRLNSAPAW